MGYISAPSGIPTPHSQIHIRNERKRHLACRLPWWMTDRRSGHVSKARYKGRGERGKRKGIRWFQIWTRTPFLPRRHIIFSGFSHFFCFFLWPPWETRHIKNGFEGGFWGAGIGCWGRNWEGSQAAKDCGAQGEWGYQKRSTNWRAEIQRVKVCMVFLDREEKLIWRGEWKTSNCILEKQINQHGSRSQC